MINSAFRKGCWRASTLLTSIAVVRRDVSGARNVRKGSLKRRHWARILISGLWYVNLRMCMYVEGGAQQFSCTQTFLHNRLGGLQVMLPGTTDWRYVKVRHPPSLPSHPLTNCDTAGAAHTQPRDLQSRGRNEHLQCRNPTFRPPSHRQPSQKSVRIRPLVLRILHSSWKLGHFEAFGRESDHCES